MSNSVLMIGLDGATFSILDPMIEQGVMPTLADLIANGVRAELYSTRNPLTPPAWTSMITGRSPEAHGIYDFLRPAFLPDGGVFLKINDFRDNRCETIWSIANRHGRRVTSLNFYGMAPPPEIDGYVISGFVPWRHLRHGTHPKSLFDSVRNLAWLDYRELGMDIGEEKKCVQGLHEGEHDAWIELQNSRDSAWSRLASHLMQTDRTELTAVVLDGPDKLQHLFWRFVDPRLFQPGGDDWYCRMRERSLGFYQLLDRNLNIMMAAAGPDTDVVIASDHGFGPTTEIFYVNEWLARQGYLTWSNAAHADSVGQLTADKLKDHLAMVDWRRTVAFCPTPSSNAIFIKKAAGSGAGIKEADYLSFALKLQSEILSFRDPGNDMPVVVAADLNKLRGASFVEPCPDITLRLRDGGFVSILKSDQLVAQRPHPEGTHRPEGIFIGHGPSFRNHSSVPALNLLDVAPLILTLLGVPVPKDMEGRVPSEVLADQRQVEKGGATVTPAGFGSDHDEPSEEERQALLRQLRVLGYMD